MYIILLLSFDFCLLVVKVMHFMSILLFLDKSSLVQI